VESLISQIGSGVHLASYPMGTRGSFPGGKAAGAWSWPLTSIKCRGPECMEIYLHSPNTPSWRGAQLKHRDNFSFIINITLFCCWIHSAYTVIIITNHDRIYKSQRLRLLHDTKVEPHTRLQVHCCVLCRSNSLIFPKFVSKSEDVHVSDTVLHDVMGL
jgi:hypothetical protein